MNNKNASKKIIRTWLVLGLIILAFIISPAASNFSVIQPAMAAPGTLTRVNIVPLTNIAFVETTFEFFFRTATTGTIKTVEITFPFNINLVDIRNATFIERSGLGPGTISATFDTTMGFGKLTYTITSPTSVISGQNVRLEVAGIVSHPGSMYFANITTKGTTGSIIDGPTKSPFFNIMMAP